MATDKPLAFVANVGYFPLVVSRVFPDGSKKLNAVPAGRTMRFYDVQACTFVVHTNLEPKFETVPYLNTRGIFFQLFKPQTDHRVLVYCDDNSLISVQSDNESELANAHSWFLKPLGYETFLLGTNFLTDVYYSVGVNGWTNSASGSILRVHEPRYNSLSDGITFELQCGNRKVRMRNTQTNKISTRFMVLRFAEIVAGFICKVECAGLSANNELTGDFLGPVTFLKARLF